MTIAFWIFAILLAVTLTGGLFRTAIGPTQSDRLSAAMLLGTNGTALMLLLSYLTDAPALVDAALVLVLLAAIATAAFVRYGSAVGVSEDRESDDA